MPQVALRVKGKKDRERHKRQYTGTSLAMETRRDKGRGWRRRAQQGGGGEEDEKQGGIER